MFERERVYRRRDIHADHSGQQQGGVATPSGKPYILVFTGGGDSYGYEDGWTEDGVFLYGGEGQIGDMEFRGGNRALRDHVADGKDLHLFKQLGKGDVRYMGCFLCVHHTQGSRTSAPTIPGSSAGSVPRATGRSTSAPRARI